MINKHIAKSMNQAIAVANKGAAVRPTDCIRLKQDRKLHG